MRNIFIALISALLFLGCSSKGASDVNVKPKLVVGKSLENIGLKDQHEKAQKIKDDTKLVIFAFSKDAAHTCNNFFETKKPTYLEENKAQFIADVSSAPSLIRSMFIMPGLKDMKHTVIIIDDKDIAKPYKSGLDSEKIVLVKLDNHKILSVETITTAKELETNIE